MPKRRRGYTMAFKKEVIQYMEIGNCPALAAEHFSHRDACNYDASIFRRWLKRREAICLTKITRKRLKGGGRDPVLPSDIEDFILDEIYQMRAAKMKVTRKQLKEFALDIAQQNGYIEFRASNQWVTSFLRRHHLANRQATNRTILLDDEVINRAVSYMAFLMRRLSHLDLSRTLLVDETPIFFEDMRMVTLDEKGSKHVIVRSTGFASMRATAVMSVWANGLKANPLVIFKGKEGNVSDSLVGPMVAKQERAWVTSAILIEWINALFPLSDTSDGKSIVWDSCRVHISNLIKDHCRLRGIELIVIPGGMTPYLQAGDIGIFKEFKDLLYPLINNWKNSGLVELTPNNRPKPPHQTVVLNWIKQAWNSVKSDTVAKCISATGFDRNYNMWHISKHDKYGSMFKTAWINRIVAVPNQQPVLDDIPEEDDLLGISDIVLDDFIEEL